VGYRATGRPDLYKDQPTRKVPDRADGLFLRKIGPCSHGEQDGTAAVRSAAMSPPPHEAARAPTG
jgi:hypothetical protein